MERSGELEGSGTVLGCGDVPRPGALSGSGVSPEVGERWVAAAGAEGSEVSSLGAVGGGVGESLEVGAGAAAASGEGPVRPGLVEVRWALPREAATGLGGTAEVASGVASGVEAAVRMSGGAEAEVSGGSAGPGAAEAGGEGAAGLVLAVVGRSRRSGHRLLWEPVSPRSLGARDGWPELLVVPGGPGVAAVGVSLAGTPPEGVSPVREGSRQSLSPVLGRRLVAGVGAPGLPVVSRERVCPGTPAEVVPLARSSPEVGSQVQGG